MDAFGSLHGTYGPGGTNVALSEITSSESISFAPRAPIRYWSSGP